MDNQLPAALARFLTSQGHEAVHVADLGLDEADDATIVREALTRDRILVSKDADMFELASRPGSAIRLVWVRVGNCRRNVLTAAFASCLGDLVASFEAGARIVEVR